MHADGGPRFSLAELVEASGIPERTVRYYITEGLVPPALGRGRSRYYTPEHLQQLTAVNQLREEKLSIDEIRERLSHPIQLPAPAGTMWRRIDLHPQLELHVAAGAPEAVEALAEEISRLTERWFGNRTRDE